MVTSFVAFFFQICKVLDISSQPERVEHILSLFNNETEEFQLLEATKLLMYEAAVQLNKRLCQGEDVPVFSMLLFARDSCECPRDLLFNHLNKTGDTGGLEQVKWTNFILSRNYPMSFGIMENEHKLSRNHYDLHVWRGLENHILTLKPKVIISCPQQKRKFREVKTKI